ncbi:MAG TPA: hypothetical protein PKI77_08170 [Mycobacterium sp.]|nr:hypothetical protein [Mycobacterium sp.]
MGDTKVPNLSWFPKPTDWPDDFDGGVTARFQGGTYTIKPTCERPPGLSQESWWVREVFVAGFESGGDTVLLIPHPTTRLEAASAVKTHQRKLCEAIDQASNNSGPATPAIDDEDQSAQTKPAIVAAPFRSSTRR